MVKSVQHPPPAPKETFCRNHPHCKWQIKQSNFSQCALTRHMKVCKIKANIPKQKRKSRQLRDFKLSEIRKCLGKGGYGVVYEARLKKFQFAVKIQELPLTEKQMDAFGNEVKAYSKIHSPCIKKGFPQVYHSEIINSEGYIFMQKMDFPLSDIAYKANTNSRQKAEILLEMTQRLEVMHKAGVIHRDLKWNNFMLKQGKLQVIDFGGCCDAPTAPIHGSAFGHLQYMGRNGHYFRIQTYTDDLQSIGWMVLHWSTVKPLPWTQICRQNKNGKIDYHVANQRVRNLKYDFISDSDLTLSLKNPFNEFVIDFLIQVCNYGFPITYPTELYSKLKSKLRSFIQNNTQQPSVWRNWVPQPLQVSDREENEGQDEDEEGHLVEVIDWNPMIRFIVPPFELNVFDESILCSQLQRKYQQRQYLPATQIFHWLQRYCRTRILADEIKTIDITTSSQHSLLTTQIRNNKPTLWMISRKAPLQDPHYGIYISVGADVLSFDGKPEINHAIEASALSMKKWRAVCPHQDGWSCGYRALFWIIVILVKGRGTENWLNSYNMLKIVK